MATFSLTFTIPDALVPRIMTALRANHPNVTTGLADGPAFKAVVRAMVRRELSGYEGQVAYGDLFAQLTTARDNAASTADSDSSAIT